MQIETCDFGLRELEPKVEQANQAMAVQTVRIDEAVAKLKPKMIHIKLYKSNLAH